MRFEGRTAVITGGAIGFGRAFARALVAEGANAVIADIDTDMAERTAAELVQPEARRSRSIVMSPTKAVRMPRWRRRPRRSVVSTS